VFNRIAATIFDENSVAVAADCRVFFLNSKLFEIFRYRLHPSFPSITIHFHQQSDRVTIDGDVKSNVQNCLKYLQDLSSKKQLIIVNYDNFPSTSIGNVVRMQQSTAQVVLHPHADYQRIFRSMIRIFDYQMRLSFKKQCLICRRTKHSIAIEYLQFPAEKLTSQELQHTIEQAALQLLKTRFTYTAIALSADLIRTKRWTTFYTTLLNHNNRDKFWLIRRVDTIIQIYGVHSDVQRIRSSISKFLDVNRYETDVIESEQVGQLFEGLHSSVRSCG
jgi:hypothetical protein